MAHRALAAIALACTIALPAWGCALDDDGPAAGQPTSPLITHPSQRPDGTPTRPGTGPIAPSEGACAEAGDVTAALDDGARRASGPAAAGHRSGGRDVPVQIVPRCSDLEVPVPFTVPDGARRPGSV